MFQLEFSNTWVLWFLLALPMLYFWYYKQQKRYYPTVKYSSTEGIRRAPVTFRTRLHSLLPVARLAALGSIIIALARPQLPMQAADVAAEGIDIMLSMDVSSSMLAKDFEPDRLDASKSVAASFIERRPDDRIGLVAFSGESYTRCPLTTDHVVLIESLETMQCGMIADGTAIGMGLANAVKRLKESTAKSKVVILLTDGVNNAGYTTPLQAAEAAKKLNVRVYTVGVGTNGKARTPIAIDAQGEFIFGWQEVQIDEDLLRQIAAETGGQYFRATDVESLEKVYAEIDRLERSKIEFSSIKRYEEHFHPWLWTALLLLAIEVVLRYTVFKSVVA